jgi:hypothetical protein
MPEYIGAVKPSSLEQANFEPDLSAGRSVEIPSNMQARWVYDSDNNCIYAAYSPRGLSESSEGWLLQKFTWVSGNCTKREIAYDSFSNYLTASYS